MQGTGGGGSVFCPLLPYTPLLLYDGFQAILAYVSVSLSVTLEYQLLFFLYLMTIKC